MESKEKEYGRQAKESDEKAETVQGTEARQIWRDIAAHWRAMAAQAKRNGW